ncbi:MAG TPA: tripartite tricarboxylate transporter TctB family protein [Thermodesulfobacteriota bacterium]|nr:tripartite tricarboxylate transporter TctB family protein [Thermodesulfobacteriota bacterium]
MQYDKVSSLVWLGVSVFIFAGSLAYTFGSWSHPGPAFLPLLCGAVMAVLSFVIFVQSVLKARAGGVKKEQAAFFTARWARLVSAVGILFAYAIFFEAVGFLAMTFLFMIFVLKVVEPSRWRTALLASVLTTGFSYLLFESWLKVPMPKGFWPGLFR